MTAQPVAGTLAPLKNVALFQGLVERVQNRALHLPGLAVFYGHSGYGKTFSAVYAANKHRAYYVEVGETWTRRTLCDAILKELGETPHGSVTDRVETIIYRLGEDADRPLIIDEADFIVRRQMVDLVREIHDKSATPVILIGEELLPAKLQKSERAHNRVLDWVAAEPCDVEDAHHLARCYSGGVHIEEDLLMDVLRASGGRARRICVNIERIREYATLNDLSRVDRAAWGKTEFFTGEPPRRRAA